jgi:hypothetical protein
MSGRFWPGRRPVGTPQRWSLRRAIVVSESGHAPGCKVSYARGMAKLKQTFHNPGDAPLFLNLELSTSRFRLNPGEELILLYDPTDRPVDEHGAALRIEMIQGADGPELVIWTAEQEMFFPNGEPAPEDYDHA